MPSTENKLKVLLVVPHFPPPEIGGGDVVYKALERHYKSAGHRVSVMFGDQNQSRLFSSAVVNNDADVDLYRMPLYPTPRGAGILSTVLPINLWALLSLKKLLRQIGPDFVHIHGYGLFMPAQVARACHRAKIDYVFTIHGAPLSPMKLRNPIISFAYWFYKKFYGVPMLTNAKTLTAVSDFAADFPEFARFRQKITVIPNGVDSGEICCAQKGYFDQYQEHRSEKTVVILSLGRIEWIKGFSEILQLMPTMIARGYDPLYFIAGRNNGERENLQLLASELGLTDRLIFLGFVTGAAKYSAISSCDVLAIPSVSETFSIVALEGRVLGKNILTTFSGGIATALLEYPNAFHLNNWSTCVTHESVTDRGVEQFDWAKIADRYLALHKPG